MKRILFDLDGTLTDPFLGITRSVAYSLKSFGIEVDDLETLKPFIGPPLDVSFREYYHMDEAQSWKAVEKYREYFSKKGLFEIVSIFQKKDYLKIKFMRVWKTFYNH